MSAKFNWHNLPYAMRYGSSPDDMITVYRGFAGHQLDPRGGMSSLAVSSGNLESLFDVIDAVEQKDLDRLIGHISTHAHNYKGALTPFVSATTEKGIAENYARNSGERVATLSVPASRLTLVPLLPYEALVLGSVEPDEITDIQDAPDRPRRVEPYPDYTGNLTIYQDKYLR